MCQHTRLAQNPDGFILWCNECKVYKVHFGNIALTLDERGLYEFKENMTICYDSNLNDVKYRNERHIFFDTHARGMKLCFSLMDVGSFLSLLQEAELSHYGLKYIA